MLDHPMHPRPDQPQPVESSPFVERGRVANRLLLDVLHDDHESWGTRRVAARFLVESATPPGEELLRFIARDGSDSARRELTGALARRIVPDRSLCAVAHELIGSTERDARLTGLLYLERFSEHLSLSELRRLYREDESLTIHLEVTRTILERGRLPKARYLDSVTETPWQERCLVAEHIHRLPTHLQGHAISMGLLDPAWPVCEATLETMSTQSPLPVSIEALLNVAALPHIKKIHLDILPRWLAQHSGVELLTVVPQGDESQVSQLLCRAFAHGAEKVSVERTERLLSSAYPEVRALAFAATLPVDSLALRRMVDRGLEDESLKVTHTALELLLCVDSKAGIKALRKHLIDNGNVPAGVRVSTLAALLPIIPATDRLSVFSSVVHEQLNHGMFARDVKAMVPLLPREDAHPVLSGLLKSKANPQVLEGVLTFFYGSTRDEDARTIYRLLRHEDHHVRSAAVAALGSMKTPEALRLIEKTLLAVESDTLTDTITSFDRAALQSELGKALQGRCSDKWRAKALQRLGQDNDPWITVGLLRALQGCAEQEALDAAIPRLNDQDVVVAQTAQQTARASAAPHALEYMTAYILDSTNHAVRRTRLAEAVLNRADAQAAFVPLLHSERKEIQAAAIREIIHRGSSSDIATLSGVETMPTELLAALHEERLDHSTSRFYEALIHTKLDATRLTTLCRAIGLLS